MDLFSETKIKPIRFHQLNACILGSSGILQINGP